MFNKKDFIFHKRRVVPQQSCDYIIRFFDSNVDLQSPGTISGGSVRPDLKIDTEIFFDGRKDHSWVLTEYLHPCVEEYKKEYPFIDTLSTWRWYPGYKMQRYNPGEGYTMLHWENDGPDSSSSRRVLGWTIYLNDVYDGGQTEFPYQNKQIQPRTGDLIIFPAGWTHAHRGIVSKTELKYIVTGWNVFKYLRIHQRNTY